jgi:hypothetical protein
MTNATVWSQIASSSAMSVAVPLAQANLKPQDRAAHRARQVRTAALEPAAEEALDGGLARVAAADGRVAGELQDAVIGPALHDGGEVLALDGLERVSEE